MSARRLNQFLAVMALAVSIFYLVYRAIYTVNTNALWFWILFYIAEVQGLFIFFLFCFETWNPQHPEHKPPEEGLSVDIFICTYDEEPELLRKTILGAQAIAYPHTTYVLDDGHRESIKSLAESLGAEYITRSDNRHAKAGNINNALQHTKGDFIAILDADHVPLSDFLDRMLGHFSDPKVGFVQSPQTFYTLDAIEEEVDYEKGFDYSRSHFWINSVNRYCILFSISANGLDH